MAVYSGMYVADMKDKEIYPVFIFMFFMLSIAFAYDFGAPTALKKDTENETVTITWHQQSSDGIIKSCGENSLGCALLQGDNCIIYAPRPKYLQDGQAFLILGKEVAHCFLGKYHE